MRLFVVLLLALAVVGCVDRPPNHPYEKELDPRSQEYVIGVSDELAITVWKNRELATSIQVRPDGTITMPLIGDIQAVDLTPTQLKQAIKEKLVAWVKDEEAVVTVAVTGVNSYFVTVAGNVTTPGRFNSQTYLTVSDAIALAGGPNRFADADQTVIIRKDPNNKIRNIPVNYEQIVAGKFLHQNIVLHRGDQIFMP